MGNIVDQTIWSENTSNLVPLVVRKRTPTRIICEGCLSIDWSCYITLPHDKIMRLELSEKQSIRCTFNAHYMIRLYVKRMVLVQFSNCG